MIRDWKPRACNGVTLRRWRSRPVAGTMSRLCATLVVATLVPGLATGADPQTASEGQPTAAGLSPPDVPAAPECWAAHAQGTFLFQYHPGFGSRVPTGPQSLDSGRHYNETTDATIYAGQRIWYGAELWINPEADQGFGIQNTLGVAGYTSGEAYKVGARDPYYRMTRAFLRQTIGLGGETETVDPDLNALGGLLDVNRVVPTAGKFSMTDIFDTNK
jgi:high affinity Mn2+ porin